MAEPRQELARRRRVVADVAARIHDLVEERALTGYAELPGLAAELVAAAEAYHALRQELEGGAGP